MFGIVLAVVAVGTFGVLALASKVQSTASKVQQGDTVTVPISQISLVDPNDGKAALDLKTFLSGFLNPATRVLNVIPAGDQAIGSIVGLAPAVKFPLSAVINITRDGQTFT